MIHMQGRSRAEMRELVVKAAVELGSQTGEDGLTMRAISAKLGVSATAIYQHFENKAAILREIRLYGTQLLHEHLEPSFALEDPKEALLGVGRAYVRFACDNPWLYTVLMRGEQLDWASLNADELSATLVSLHAMHRLIGSGRECGDFCQSISTEVCALQIWATMHGLAQLIVDGRLQEGHPAIRLASLDTLVDSCLRASIRGISAVPRDCEV
jgi:AcrR family transcriptional regulator